MIKIVELFAGIGSQAQALRNLKIEHEVVAISEIDKYALISYEALHGKPNNLGDIRKIEKLPEADLWTYSFPCQNISVAGRGEGLSKGSGTSSGLLWEVERLLLQAQQDGTLPKYLILENVKNLIGHKHKANFEKWLAFLQELGYRNHYKVLNSKHYGVPQNRERLFCVSILGEGHFEFEPPKPLEVRLHDWLEAEVDEKYYLSDTSLIRILNSTFNQERGRLITGDIAPCLLARDYKDQKVVIDPKCVKVGDLTGGKWDKIQQHARRIYSPEGIAPTVHCSQGGNTTCKVVVAGQFQPKDRSYNKKGTKREEQFECRKDEVANAILTGDKKNCVAEIGKSALQLIGYYKKMMQGNRIYSTAGVSATITAKGGSFGGSGGGLYKEVAVYDDYNSRLRGDSDTIGTLTTNIGVAAVRNGYKLIENDPSDDSERGVRVRKLTPKECLRLMGWDDESIAKIQAAGLSNSQQYKQAGNGIVLQVLESIFRQLFKATH